MPNSARGSEGQPAYDACYYCGEPVKKCGSLCPSCQRMMEERESAARRVEDQMAAEYRAIAARKRQ